MEGYTDILENERRIQVASSLSSPIIIEGKFCGLLNLDSSKNNIFGDEDLEIMQFLADQISHVLSFQQLLNKTIYLSRYDQLTGLLNRWYLKEFETVILPHAVRFEETFIFVMMDINHLKRINDSLGHAVGDYYLCEFSRIAKEHARETDLSIRIGGDEFVSIYFEIAPEQLVMKLADQRMYEKKLEMR
jgi:GGDEF domain-containing protein